jgi:hypothetical protein
VPRRDPGFASFHYLFHRSITGVASGSKGFSRTTSEKRYGKQPVQNQGHHQYLERQERQISEEVDGDMVRVSEDEIMKVKGRIKRPVMIPRGPARASVALKSLFTAPHVTEAASV